ncbi:MAG: hypothetical protein LUC91_03790 [Prevotella sp.]|nr:hypothetical protein [Prevotella sp.]
MKTIKILSLVAVALPMAFISCSDDDDEASYDKSVSMVSTDDGNVYQLTSIKVGSYNRYVYNYDDEGRCTYFYDWGDKYYIEQPGFKITTDDEDESISVSFNGDGYVSKITWSESYDDYDEVGTETLTSTYSYSGSNLTKVSFSYTDKWKEDGKSYTGTESGSLTLTWKNGNLTKMTGSYTGKDNYEDYTESGTDTYTFEYGNSNNGCKQFLIALAYQIEDYDDFITAFGMAGFMGKGPADLPTSCTCEYSYKDSDGDNGSYEDTFESSYSSYSDGRIRTETCDGTTYTYGYASYEDDTRAAIATPFDDAFSAPEKANGKRMHGIHNRHHSRHAKAAE